MAEHVEWTDDELRATVESYLFMLGEEIAGRPVNKSALRRELRAGPLASRTNSSIEFRMQNISAVLERLGRQWVSGYRPAANVGTEKESRIREIIAELQGGRRGGVAPPLGSPVAFREVVPSPDLLMGVKAVYGPIAGHVLCSAGRGDPANPKQFYSVMASAATRAATQPFVVAIGGGKGARPGTSGRVLSLARVSTVYGPTAKLVADPIEVGRLAQWPVAVALHQVWQFTAKPHLVNDLGFEDRTILAGSQDGIIRPADKIDQLWQALAALEIVPIGLPLPANFYDSGSPTFVAAELPGLPPELASDEGKEIWRFQRTLERDPKLAVEAKRANKEAHGAYTCEACGFQDSDPGMFDAHHPTPLSAGKRTTFASHLEVLCPTCHRRAHRPHSRLHPLPLITLRKWASSKPGFQEIEVARI